MLKLLQLNVLLMSGLLTAYSQSSLSSNTTSNTVSQPAVDTLAVTEKTLPHYVYLDARLEAVNQSTISAQTSGIIEAVKVDINDSVKAGQTLVLINNTQQQAQLSQAIANLAQAQAQNEDAQILLKRNKSLLAKKTLSQGEFDSSAARAKSTQAQVAASRALLKQAKEQLSYTHVKAPYSGIVSERMVQVGELVNPGQPLMTGFASQPLRAVTDIPKHLTSYLKNSQSIDHQNQPEILIHTHDKTIRASRYTLFPYADSRYSSIRARIDLPELESEGLLPGSWVEIALPIGNKKGIYLPKSAVLQQGEVSTIYIKSHETTKFKVRYVRLGQIINNQQVQIISGLNPSEEVATDAAAAALTIQNTSAEQ